METFESQLQFYIKTNQISDELYVNLKRMAVHIALKYKIKAGELDDTAHDIVTHSVQKLQDNYDNGNKASARTFLYVTMTNWLINKLKYTQALKRSTKTLIYIEDMNNHDILYEISYNDEYAKMRECLLQHRQLILSKMNTKLQRKIAGRIITIIELDKVKKKSLVNIAKRYKCSLTRVYEVIKMMRDSVNNSSVNNP